MLWRLRSEGVDAGDPAPPADAQDGGGRFVLHRHTDADGAHCDVRLEAGGCLVGWRVHGEDIATEPAWATEKMPHPLHWLAADGPATRLDAGAYAWLERGPDRKVLLLRGAEGTRRVTAERAEGLTAGAVAAVVQQLEAARVALDRLPLLVAEGITARQRAVARLVGLGRALDGEDFDAALAKRMLAGLTLDEIHAHLRGYERRFDTQYPPRPVSRPEPMETEDERMGEALAILRGAAPGSA